MKYRKLLLLSPVFLLGLVFMCLFYYLTLESNPIVRLGSQYVLKDSVYLMGEYNDLNKRVVSPDSATAYLQPEKYAERAFTAFHQRVPSGTVITIMETLPPVWYLPFMPDRYLVQLDPDVSQGLDVVLSLDRGFEGDEGNLNSAFFDKVE